MTGKRRVFALVQPLEQLLCDFGCHCLATKARPALPLVQQQRRQRLTAAGAEAPKCAAVGGAIGFDFGETKTAIDFTRAWDVTDQGDRSTSYGAFLVQDIDDYGLQLYTGYRNYDLNRDDDLDLDDIHVWSMGMAVNFGADVSFGGPF